MCIRDRINTYEGVTKALAQGGIFGIALGASVLASGLATVRQIKEQKPQRRAFGGMVEAGDQAMVGEQGKEIVTFGDKAQITPNNELDENPVGVGANINQAIVNVQVGFGIQSQATVDAIARQTNRIFERGAFENTSRGVAV